MSVADSSVIVSTLTMIEISLALFLSPICFLMQREDSYLAQYCRNSEGPLLQIILKLMFYYRRRSCPSVVQKIKDFAWQFYIWSDLYFQLNNHNTKRPMACIELIIRLNKYQINMR